jgi:hypothetical protein
MCRDILQKHVWVTCMDGVMELGKQNHLPTLKWSDGWLLTPMCQRLELKSCTSIYMKEIQITIETFIRLSASKVSEPSHRTQKLHLMNECNPYLTPDHNVPILRISYRHQNYLLVKRINSFDANIVLGTSHNTLHGS